MQDYTSVITGICSSREQKFKYDGISPDPSIIEEILTNAYTHVPSKQLLMPYTVYVYGPQCSDQKQIIFDYATFRSPNAVPEQCANYQLENVPYILVFTDRIINLTDLNASSFAALYVNDFDIGDRSYSHRSTWTEIGLFQMLIVLFARTKNLDVSFCNCFNGKKMRTALGLSEKIITTMSIGTSVPINDITDPYIKYKHNSYKKQYYPDRSYLRPSYGNVIKFV